jgi:DNA invertase Pin-like site-specific DNA recombinase
VVSPAVLYTTHYLERAMPQHSTSHPYVRISHPDQRKGGGLERQTTADLAEFNRLYGFTLSKRVLVDDGVSAFHGLNATPGHQLGQFLAEARKGLIPAGDCLLIENYDRLSRQDQWAAIGLVSELRSLKIHVGRLDRMKLLRWDSDDPGDFFEAAVEFMRGHSESRAKSVRNGAAWKRKRKAARENGRTITHRLPAWIEVKNGERVAIPHRADIIRRIFQLTANGYGHAMIVKKFTAEGVPAFGEADHWARSYIALLLKDERVLGRLQPRLRSGEPDGDPISDYYPPVVSQVEWDAARGGSAQRKNRRGRQAKFINPFAGLLRNALDDDSYYVATRTDGGKHTKVLVNTHAAEGRAAMRSFPYAVFEQAILSALAEIDPHSILNGDSGPDESLALAGQLAGVEAELAAAKAFMAAKGFSVSIGERLIDLEAAKRDVSERLALARQRAAHPLSESWGEAQSLAGIVETARANGDDEPLLRLQAALRRIVSAIRLLIVPRGRSRLCAVQIHLGGSEQRRDYLIYHRPAIANQSGRVEGSTSCVSLADVAKLGPCDLRQPADARKLEALLVGVNLETLLAALQAQPDLNAAIDES